MTTAPLLRLTNVHVQRHSFLIENLCHWTRSFLQFLLRIHRVLHYTFLSTVFYKLCLKFQNNIIFDVIFLYRPFLVHKIISIFSLAKTNKVEKNSRKPDYITQLKRVGISWLKKLHDMKTVLRTRQINSRAEVDHRSQEISIKFLFPVWFFKITTNRVRQRMPYIFHHPPSNSQIYFFNHISSSCVICTYYTSLSAIHCTYMVHHPRVQPSDRNVEWMTLN